MKQLPVVLIASGNKGKRDEIQAMLAGVVHCLGPEDPSFDPSICPQVNEDGHTYYENALKKALAYYQAYRVPVLADDSGLEVDLLGGGPGVYSARFGGETLTWPERWTALIKQLENFPNDPLKARFCCVLCFYDGERAPLFFHGRVEGCITRKPQGTGGFGFDPIFFSTELQKTFGEARPEEKARISHRSRALRMFRDWYHRQALDRRHKQR